MEAHYMPDERWHELVDALAIVLDPRTGRPDRDRVIYTLVEIGGLSPASIRPVDEGVEHPQPGRPVAA